jgi:hypothetical protein
MKTFTVRKWIDETASVTGTNEKNYYPLPYFNLVKDYFIESQMNCNLSEEESQDLFDETPFSKIETFLKKSGYDLGGNNYE